MGKYTNSQRSLSIPYRASGKTDGSVFFRCALFYPIFDRLPEQAVIAGKAPRPGGATSKQRDLSLLAGQPPLALTIYPSFATLWLSDN